MPEDGLAAFGDGRDDLMMALARQIVSGKEDADADTVEAVVGQAGDAEAASEDYLMDDGCKLFEVEPKAVVVKGIGHQDEVPEPQQLPFSWAEYMAEVPVKTYESPHLVATRDNLDGWALLNSPLLGDRLGATNLCGAPSRPCKRNE